MPRAVQQNDIVCDFHACDAVAVLRPSGGGHCKIVGTALLFPCKGMDHGSPRLGSESIEVEKYSYISIGGEEVAFHLDLKTLRALTR
jgi:hypothetical protein